MAKNTWFEETFLPSFDSKMNNPKYPDQCILSEKQAEICWKNMEHHDGYDSDYRKSFVYLTYSIGGTKYMVEYRGRYTFLRRWKEAYKPSGARRIRIMRLDRNEALYGREYA